MAFACSQCPYGQHSYGAQLPVCRLPAWLGKFREHLQATPRQTGEVTNLPRYSTTAPHRPPPTTPRSHAPPARDTPASHASLPSPSPLFLAGAPRSPSAVSGRLCCPNRRSTGGMDKLVQFGKKAWFVVRVMSGYEERRIRSYRLLLQQRLEQAQAKKKEIEKQPEQVILSEVRQVVQQMQALNQHLEEAETAIDEYFKPIDKNAQMLTDMQMEKEEKQMKEMLQVMRGQIQMQREIEARKAEASAVEPVDTQPSETTAGIPPKQETTSESPPKQETTK